MQRCLWAFVNLVNRLKERNRVRFFDSTCEAPRHNAVAKSATLAALLLAALSSAASAQLPVISQGGVVNAASYTQPVVPGSIMAIFGTNLASGVYSAAATPLPTILGNTSVSMNGVPAPLFYVSPNQINAQVPSSLSSRLQPWRFQHCEHRHHNQRRSQPSRGGPDLL